MSNCENCARLQARIDELEAELEAAFENSYHAREEATRRVVSAERETRQTRDDAEARNWERQGLLRDLERAQERGDQYDVRRTMDRLRHTRR